MAKFSQQFEPSAGWESPKALAPAPPRVAIDGAAVLDRYASRARDAGDMSGGELFAVIGHIKKEHGAKGDALEAELMKIGRQKDKKIRLMDWVGEHLAIAPPAPLEQLSQLSLNAPPDGGGGPPGTPGGVMPRLNLGAATPGNGKAFGERPATARPNYGGGNPITAAFSPPPTAPSGAQTARGPAPAAGGAAAVPDMTAVAIEYAAGKDHAKMSGAEYHHLVGWLKIKGHADLEDVLMRVRVFGDKKFQLVKHLKERCADLLGASPQPQLTPHGAQVMQISHAASSPTYEQMAMASNPLNPQPPPQQQQMQHQPPPPQQQPPPPQLQASAPVQQPPPPPQQQQAAPASASVLQCVSTLEQTVMRLEESFAFAVECMQTDLAAAKEQLRQLKAQVAQ